MSTQYLFLILSLMGLILSILFLGVVLSFRENRKELNSLWSQISDLKIAIESLRRRFP